MIKIHQTVTNYYWENHTEKYTINLKEFIHVLQNFHTTINQSNKHKHIRVHVSKVNKYTIIYVIGCKNYGIKWRKTYKVKRVWRWLVFIYNSFGNRMDFDAPLRKISGAHPSLIELTKILFITPLILNPFSPSPIISINPVDLYRLFTSHNIVDDFSKKRTIETNLRYFSFYFYHYKSDGVATYLLSSITKK